MMGIILIYLRAYKIKWCSLCNYLLYIHILKDMLAIVTNNFMMLLHGELREAGSFL